MEHLNKNNTTTNAHSGLSAVNSQCHVSTLLNHTDACTQTQCAHAHAHTPLLYLPQAVENTHTRHIRALIRTYFPRPKEELTATFFSTSKK